MSSPWHDELAALAANLCDCPIGMVSLVEDEHQCLIGRVGLKIRSTPRDHAFCAHAILQEAPLIVPDARADPRFADNPLVTSDPHIVFYAGIVLKNKQGLPLGTLCVIDTAERTLTPRQLGALEALGHMACDHIAQHSRASNAESSLAIARNEREELLSIHSTLRAEVQRQSDLVYELAATARKATALNRAKSEFIANISHEIRTPMTAILGYADLLAQEHESPLLPTERANALASIQRNGQHLLNIINDLLDISKIDAGKLDIESVPVAIPDLLEGIAQNMRPRARDKGLALVLDRDPSVPDAVMSDPTRIRQILLNLVGNAIKFTEKGGVTIAAAFRRTDPNTAEGILTIDIKDTGIGITQQQMARLFKPFTQADPSTSRKHGGAGLGLNICSSLAKLLSGSIATESTPGVGSTFTLTIPVATCQLPTNLRPIAAHITQDRTPPPVQPPPAMSLAGSTILLVEDGPDNQMLISSLLTRAGATVAIAANGLEAIERTNESIASGQPPDLILMDIQMPIVDGYEATKRLRAQGVMIPIVALTAHAMRGERERCINVGCDDYLTKPIDRAELIARVASWIARSHRACKTA
ncbi:MAG: response regulator [Phycisphaerales bacterium]